MTNLQQKRYSTDIKAGRIFLTRKLFFAYLRTKAYMVVCLTKQGQYALIYKDKTRKEQLAFFNIKNCVIRREADNQSRVIVDFQNSNSARCLQFDTRDLEDAESWVQAFTGKQESRVHALNDKQQESRVHALNDKQQESRVHALAGKQESQVHTLTGKQQGSREHTLTGKQESRIQASIDMQESRVQMLNGRQESQVHAFTGRQGNIRDKTKKINVPVARNIANTNLADYDNSARAYQIYGDTASRL